MKKILLIFLFFCSFILLQAQETDKDDYKNWVHEAPRLKDSFFITSRAKEIAETVLLYQQTTGGWPKNINMFIAPRGKARKKALETKNDISLSTIDNQATTTEIIYLLRLYNATQDEKYREAAIRGLHYLFEAQYENGGWPQFYPRSKGYHIQITYNDNAMIDVLKLMHHISKGDTPFNSLSDTIRRQAELAMKKGITCILKTQVVQNEKLTVWCAQHDRKTLLPCGARAYELPSLSGQESADIVLFLMSLPNPPPQIIASIEAAVAWFKKSEIKNLRKEFFINEAGEKDYRIITCHQKDSSNSVMWSRFYELETNRPFFCDRDGVKKYNLSEIGYERRNHYKWYNNKGLKVYETYEKWKMKNKPE